MEFYCRYLLIVVFILFSCHASDEGKIIQSAGQDNRDKFEDIDLFNLKGIKFADNKISYPFIVVDSMDDQTMKIVYYAKATDSAQRIYTLKDGYWTTNYESPIDTGICTTYEFIGRNEIILLDYFSQQDRKNYLLHDVGLHTPGKITQYGFHGEPGVEMTPHPNNFALVKQNAKAYFIDSYYHRFDTKLCINSKSFNLATNKPIYSGEICYDIGRHSFFWWAQFGHTVH